MSLYVTLSRLIRIDALLTGVQIRKQATTWPDGLTNYSVELVHITRWHLLVLLQVVSVPPVLPSEYPLGNLYQITDKRDNRGTWRDPH
jgi:hypothetical protein